LQAFAFPPIEIIAYINHISVGTPDI